MKEGALFRGRLSKSERGSELGVDRVPVPEGAWKAASVHPES